MATTRKAKSTTTAVAIVIVRIDCLHSLNGDIRNLGLERQRQCERGYRARSFFGEYFAVSTSVNSVEEVRQ
jgi:hypothetical protein